MSDIILPNRNITGDNLWSQVESNDQAIVNTVNGDLDDGNLATEANISGTKLADNSLPGAKLVTDSVTATQMAPNSVGASELADGAVDTAALQDGSVTAAKLSLGQVGTFYEYTGSGDFDVPTASEVSGGASSVIPGLQSTTLEQGGLYQISVDVGFYFAGPGTVNLSMVYGLGGDMGVKQRVGPENQDGLWRFSASFVKVHLHEPNATIYSVTAVASDGTTVIAQADVSHMTVYRLA